MGGMDILIFVNKINDFIWVVRNVEEEFWFLVAVDNHFPSYHIPNRRQESKLDLAVCFPKN